MFDMIKINELIRTKGAACIDHYIDDGIKKVCDVNYVHTGNFEWEFSNADQSIMFSDHRSWVYFIVLGMIIMKIGETGNPLGIPYAACHIRKHLDDPNHWIHSNPRTGTRSRLGRLRSHHDCNHGRPDTDYVIRESLYEKDEPISIWAKKCDITYTSKTFGGREILVEQTTHKAEELIYLREYRCMTGTLPALNKSNK